MATDASTMTIIAAVGGTCVTGFTALMQYIRALHKSTVAEMHRENAMLAERADQCEEDRNNLHGRINEQSERISALSRELGRLEKKVDKNHEE